MNINIKANHGLELTEAIKNYTEKKIFEASKNFEKDIHINIELEKISNHHVHGNVYKAEARVSGSVNFIVSELKNNLYAAIDGLKDKVENEMFSKHKKQRSIFKKIGQNFKDFLKNKIK